MTPDIAYCPHCGKSALPGASFCAWCGKPFPATAQPSQPGNKVSRSIPLPEDINPADTCLVIHTGDSAMNIPSVGRVVARATELPLGDVTRRMRTTKGFVATGIQGQIATDLANQLAELGVHTFVLPQADGVPLPEIIRMRRIETTGHGLSCEAYTWNQTESIHVSWEEVFLISAGRLALERVSERERQVESGNPFDRLVPNLTTSRYNEFLIDILLFEPWRRLRLDYNLAAYAFTDAQADPQLTLREIQTCARGLLTHGHNVPTNAGAALLAGQSEEWEWEKLTFLSKTDFDSYTHWLLQLVRYGFPIPA